VHDPTRDAHNCRIETSARQGDVRALIRGLAKASSGRPAPCCMDSLLPRSDNLDALAPAWERVAGWMSRSRSASR
jgi:hypothetical protein